MVDHLKLHEGGSDDYLFGTTRTYKFDGTTSTFSQAHIFRVRLKSDHKIDDGGGHDVSRLSSAALGNWSYVTGISNELENSD